LRADSIELRSEIVKEAAVRLHYGTERAPM
jgi:hypothetical protein